MSEKAPIVYTDYSATTSSKFRGISRCIERIEDNIELANIYYAKAIRKIHAREFLAEFLATFVLVVSVPRYNTGRG